MSRSTDPRLRELYRLADAHCESKLSQEQAARLSELLTDDPRLRGLFVEYMQVHSLIERDMAVMLAEECESAPPDPFPGLLNGTLDAIQWSRHPGRFCLVVFAATSLIWLTFFGLVFLGMRPGERASGVSGRAEPLREIAHITRTLEATWANPDTAPPGPHLYKGARLNLAEGFLKLQYQTGAELIVEAPALATVVGVNMLHIERGRLTATVPNRAVGFTVSTPSAMVVDLGTEFGVSVDATGERTDLSVFSGKARAELMIASADSGGGRKQVVAAGQLLRLDASTGKTTLRKDLGERFVRRMPVKPGGVCANLKIVNPSFEQPDVRTHRLFRPGAGDVALMTAPGWRANRWRNTLGFQQGRCTLAPYGEGSVGKPYGPAATDGKQVAKMLVQRRGEHNEVDATHAWLYQSLGVVSEADLGKTLTLAVDAASREQYPESCQVVPKDGASVTAAFVVDVSDSSTGRQVGRPGHRERLMRGDGTVTLKGRLTIGPELVGQEIAVLLLVVETDPSVEHGTHYHFDNVRCEVSSEQ